jgi:hypothetical protein
MKKIIYNSLSELKNLNNNIYYKGKLSTKQLKGYGFNGQIYSKPGVYRLSVYQNELYKRALYGLNYYNEKELINMNSKKKKRIRKVNIKAQKTLNLYKQAMLNKYLNEFFIFYFPNNRIGKFNTIDTGYICRSSFKDLNITKKEIVNLFIEKGILANNFYKL